MPAGLQKKADTNSAEPRCSSAAGAKLKRQDACVLDKSSSSYANSQSTSLYNSGPSACFKADPEETCVSLGNFYMESCVSDSSVSSRESMSVQGSAAPDPSNRNQSSVQEMHASAVFPLQSKPHSSSVNHVQSDKDVSTLFHAHGNTQAVTVYCAHSDTQACAGHHKDRDAQPPPVISQKGRSSKIYRQNLHSCLAGCSEIEHDASASESPLEDEEREENVGPGLEDLPRDVLLSITHYLPTVSLIALAHVHPVFTEFLTDTQFLNRQARRVLGFAASEKDITYDAVPCPVAHLQNLWFQTYLHCAASHMVGLVTPGAVFYDLLCFKHLLDTWILQGLGYRYWMFVSDVLKGKQPPPLRFIHCQRLVSVSTPMLNMLTKVALCHPHVLLQTVNNFESLTICERSLSNRAWDLNLPEEFKLDSGPQDIFEVVSRQRGKAGLASFFFTFNSHNCVGWSGLIDYSTFRWRNTSGLCKFSVNAPLSVIRKQSCSVFEQFSEYVGQEYISRHGSEAFLIRGLRRLLQKSKLLLHQLQTLLEKNSGKIHRKLCKTLPSEVCAEAKTFLDGVAFMGKEEDLGSSGAPPKKQSSSRTLEVAVQRYLHRYLNQVIGRQVLDLFQDPVCHRLLCVSCHNSHSLTSPPCLKQVGGQHVPLKIWPPHLLQHALTALPALARLVCLDLELWRRSLLDQPLSGKAALFVTDTLGAAVCLDLRLDPGRPGVIARRIFRQK
ncbi:hypothetical protein ACOMHN_033560 [Nucella lapillus]